MNVVILMGNLGRDPEIRSFQSGGQIATFTLATTKRWKKDGETQEKTTWHTVVVKDEKKVPVVRDYLRKGNRVLVRGELESRKFTDKDGNERTVWEVVIGFTGEIVLMGNRANNSKGEADEKPKPDENPLDDDIPW